MNGQKLIYIFAGCTGCGKTSISKAFASVHGMAWTSFGDTVRAEAKALDLDSTNKNILQKLGQQLVEQEQERFCDLVLRQLESSGGVDGVIDGLRHKKIFALLKQKLPAEKYRLVYINIETLNRHRRLIENRGWTGEQCLQYDSDATEVEIESQLRPLADLEINNNGTLEAAIAEIEKWFIIS